MILQVFGQKVEFLAEARNADGEIVVFFRVLFCIDQGVCVNGVELHIFKDAPHGIALGNEITKCGNEAWLCGGSWPELAKIWMKNI